MRRPKKQGGGIYEFGGRMVPAHPFLLPAAEQNISRIRQIIADQLRNITDGKVPAATTTDKVIT